jgi:SAM-dependent methyltransferase
MSMPCQLLTPSLSEAASETRRFYDRWIGGSGLLSILGRLIFNLSGVVYSGRFIQVARLTPDHSILEIGCGIGTILTATQRRLCSTSLYLGVDLSFQMVAQGYSSGLENGHQKRVSLLVASGLSVPVNDSLFERGLTFSRHQVSYGRRVQPDFAGSQADFEAGWSNCPLGISSGVDPICHEFDSEML